MTQRANNRKIKVDDNDGVDLGVLNILNIIADKKGWYNDLIISTNTTISFETTGHVNNSWFKTKLTVTNSVITFSGNIQFETSNTYNFGETHDIVCTSLGTGKSGLKLYIDNVLIVTTPFTFGSYTAMHGDNGNQQLQIGGTDLNGNEKTVDGLVSDFVVWNKELTIQDVAELWDNGSRAFDFTTHSEWGTYGITGFKFNNNLVDEKSINTLIGVNSPNYGDI